MPVPGQDDFADRQALRAWQWDRLAGLLAEISPRNRFYARKFAQAGVEPAPLASLADLKRLPLTTKAELIQDQETHPPHGSTLTYPATRYCRLHQTSGTTSGRPLRWLDTPESWQGLLDCWAAIFRMVGVGQDDRLFFPFSFGPFLGFWTAFDAAVREGYFCLAGGGMSGGARLRFMLDNQATVVLCTPTYALHLAEVARTEGIDLAATTVRALIVAGEPGGSILPTRQRIEAAWGARVFDHSGMTEVGPTSIECQENPGGLHLLEAHYLGEVIDPATEQEVALGELGELVLTTLNRWGSPLIRYRTGDLVRVDPGPCRCGRVYLRFEGGILGRTDDMIHLRGNNVYPAALEAIIRRFPEVVEYRIQVDPSASLAELRIEVEVNGPGLANDLPERVARAIRDELLFRAEVQTVPPGTLPRFEMKAQRLVRRGGK